MDETDTGEDARIGRVAALLAANGIGGVRVSAAGHQREIAALEAAPLLLARIAELAPEIKAIGFRYVAVDIATAGDSA